MVNRKEAEQKQDYEDEAIRTGSPESGYRIPSLRNTKEYPDLKAGRGDLTREIMVY
jgi:hypothetical protein